MAPPWNVGTQGALLPPNEHDVQDVNTFNSFFSLKKM